MAISEVVVDFLSVQGVKTAKKCTTETCYFFANNQQGGSINARPAVCKGEGYIFGLPGLVKNTWFSFRH